MFRVTILFGLLMTLVNILGTENGVYAAPELMPGLTRYEFCRFLRKIQHSNDLPNTAATPTPEDKATEDRKEKIELFGNLLQELLTLQKEAENKKEEVKKSKEEQIKEQPKGFTSMNDMWDKYVQFLTTLFYSF